jgi:tripartite-type tricarboxylate transporter receptor subunit TctC
MSGKTLRFGIAAVLAGAVAAPGAPAWAAFPDKPITVLVAFRAGGGADTLARLITKAIEKKLGWKFVVKNRTGGGGSVMAKVLMHQKPDGYTIGMSVSPVFGADPVYKKKLGFGADDFTYLGTVANFQMAVVALPGKGWKTLDDAMAAAKKNGSITWASMGVELHNAALMAGRKYGVKVKVVPTRGGAGVMAEVLGGHVDIGWGAGIQARYVDAGKMVILASGQGDRLKQAPNKKTFRELGIPIDTGGYFLMVGPKGIPADRVKTLSEAIREATQDPDVRTLINKRLRLVTVYKGPEATRQHILAKRDEAKRVAAAMKK